VLEADIAVNDAADLRYRQDMVNSISKLRTR